jgi:two-component system cell cycle response regulator
MAGKKLLVADDSLTIQKVIRLALSNEGYEIQAVSDGNDAAQQISLFRPDVVLIDVSLPGKSAFEVKKIVNSQPDTRNVRFVLMSSAFEKVDEQQAGEVGFDGRLTKPFDPAHLRQVLQEVLATAAPSGAEGSTTFIQAPPAPPQEDLDPLLPEEHTEELPILREELPFTAPPDPFANLAPPPRVESDSDQDIKHLTESTIRMSGLDDFQWSVNEPAKKPGPPPVPSRDETGEYRFDDPTIRPPGNMADAGGSNFRFDKPMDAVHEPTYEIEKPVDSPMLPTEPPPSYSAAPSDFTGSTSYLPAKDLEEAMRKQISETLERMARQILPEVAERVIKQEIHKLLTSPPA